MFTIEISGLPPNTKVDFSIKLMLVVAPTSKASYRMSTPKLVELKLQLKEIIDKGYIRPSVSPWVALVLLVKNKEGVLRLCID